jgi:hypothetical protein
MKWYKGLKLVSITMSSSMNTPMLPKNINVSEIKFGDLKVSEIGSKSAYVSYGGDPFVFQIPSLDVAFTMSKFGQDKDVVPQADVVEKYPLQLALKGIESNKAVAYFSKFLKELDTEVVSAGVRNTRAWFKKVQTEEVVREFYSSPLTFPKDKITGDIIDKYPPTFRITVPVLNGKIKTPCVDDNDNPIDVKFPIERGTRLSAIVQCSSAWFGGSKFGLSLRPIKFKILSCPTNFKAFAFNDDDDEMPTAAANVVATTAAAASDDDDEEYDLPVLPNTNMIIESSSDEEDDEDMSAAAAAIPAVPAVPEAPEVIPAATTLLPPRPKAVAKPKAAKK